MKSKWVKTAKLIGVVFALLLAITQLLDWVAALPNELEAEVTFSPLRIPPGLEQEFVRLHSLADEDWLAGQVGVDHLLAEEETNRFIIEQIISDLAYSLRSEIPFAMPTRYSLLAGYYDVAVVNRGDKAISGVKLWIRSEQVLLIREGAEASYFDSTGVVELGELQPREAIRLVAWSRLEPTINSTRSIRLTHEAGVGDISVRAPVGGLGLWVDQNKFFLAVVIPVLVVWGAFSVASYRLTVKKGASSIQSSVAEDQIE